MLTGKWEDSSEEGFKGFYDATEECPDYGHDFDCRRPHKGAALMQIIPEIYVECIVNDLITAVASIVSVVRSDTLKLTL